MLVAALNAGVGSGEASAAGLEEVAVEIEECCIAGFDSRDRQPLHAVLSDRLPRAGQGVRGVWERSGRSYATTALMLASGTADRTP